MRSVQPVMYCVVATLSVGCPGTLDDPAAYRDNSYAPASASDAESGPSDDDDDDDSQAATSADAGAIDATARDAGQLDALIVSPLVEGGARDTVEAGSQASAQVDANASDATVARDAGSSTFDASANCDFRALIAAKCGNGRCHGALAVSSGLDLTSDKLAQRVAGKKASLSCSSHLLIDTERPDQSALYLKVTKDACGSRMPLGGTLTDGEQMCILQWITNL